jgi:hypothetical protein
VRARIPITPTLVCLALCGAILACAAGDLLHTASRLPSAEPLQDQYDTRAWLYAFAVVAIVALTLAWELRTRKRPEWVRVFTNLGVVGVWLAIAAAVLLLVTDGSSLAPPAGPTLLIPLVLLLTAAAGTLAGRSEGWAQRSQGDGVRDRVVQAGKVAIDIGTAGQIRRSRMEELARWLTLATVGLTALTCLLSLVFVLAQPGCDAGTSPPAWTNPIESGAAVTAIAATAAALGVLLLRRWLVALLGLVVCPIAVLLMVASTCAFY